MIKIKNLQSGYNKSQVIKEIDMSFAAGEITAIIGPNGAGKSTLLKSIFNLCDINSGKIFFKDKNIKKLPTYDLINFGISYVPQGRQVFTNMTVKENLEMGAFVFKEKELINKNIEDIYRKFPILKQKQNQNAATLSGGQQQMLAIARSLIQNPELLLLDEPSLGLSPKMMKEVFAKIVEINKRGVTVILVEQNAKQAVEIADKTYILENGTVALVGGKEILKSKKIKDIYFGGV
ncbi:ABC transporter ATP-binding protein [Patescibacteria group bacterium]|nr:ABC transporter ATP-binding protein [Patescibacteria group bacterium]MBU1721646.1 ABC transporter ATP-binding protein [Patescibacteria group bacterium]MBU1901643.1 ABC transporter ATP-binding protein [Patescibacteria group bacterium]